MTVQFASDCHGSLLLSNWRADSTLPQYEVYKKLVWERGWGGGGKSDEDVYEVIIMDDNWHASWPHNNLPRDRDPSFERAPMLTGAPDADWGSQ